MSSDSFLSRVCERFIVLPTERENAVYYSTNFLVKRLFLGKSDETNEIAREIKTRQRQRGARRERERERGRRASQLCAEEEEEEKKI